jgi:hypothetical protein
MCPAGLGRHPENVDCAVLVGVFGVGAVCAFGFKLGVLLLEGIGKDETKDDVLVLCGIHAAAQRIGHFPELGFVADGGASVLWCRLAKFHLTRRSRMGVVRGLSHICYHK